MNIQEIQQLYSNICNWLLNNLPLILLIGSILQLIGIIRHYKVNIYSLGHIVYFPICLVVVFFILMLICTIAMKDGIYLLMFLIIGFPFLFLFYGFVSIAILLGKWTIHYIRIKNILSKRSASLDLNWIVSIQPIKKQNKNKIWTEEGIKQNGISEESYSKAEQFLGRNIKTNSDFIKKNKDQGDWE